MLKTALNQSFRWLAVFIATFVIAGAFILPIKAFADRGVTWEDEMDSQDYNVVVTSVAGSLNVRVGPGTDYAVITVLQNKDKAHVIGSISGVTIDDPDHT